MHIKLLISAAAIALVAGLGSASADENFGTLDGISAFDALAGIQAVPLVTDEMASVTAMLYFRLNTKTGELIPLFNGHTTHYSHYKDYGSGEKGPGHGIKYPRGGGVEDISAYNSVADGTDLLHNQGHIDCACGGWAVLPLP